MSWKWRGTDYNKNRGNGADKPFLELHVEALGIWFQHCPTGYPSKVQARDLLLQMNSKYSAVLNDLPKDWEPLDMHERAGKAETKWKTMLRHSVELCFPPKPVANPEWLGQPPRLQDALNLIQPDRKSRSDVASSSSTCRSHGSKSGGRGRW